VEEVVVVQGWMGPTLLELERPVKEIMGVIQKMRIRGLPLVVVVVVVALVQVVCEGVKLVMVAQVLIQLSREHQPFMQAVVVVVLLKLLMELEVAVLEEVEGLQVYKMERLVPLIRVVVVVVDAFWIIGAQIQMVRETVVPVAQE
jgi:hypothetical protein